MLYTLLSLILLGVSPIVYNLIHRLGHRSQFVEKALFLIICGIVVLHLFPESFRLAGVHALWMGVLGWGLPTLAEKIFPKHHVHFDALPLILSTFGINIHCAMDGFSFALSEQSKALGFIPDVSFEWLPIAILIHRLPAAVFIWWLLCFKYSHTLAAWVLAVMGMATILGYAAGSWLLGGWITSNYYGMFQGLVAGSLLHLASHGSGAFHRHHPRC